MKIVWCAAAIILLASRARAADEIYVQMKGDAPAILNNGGEFKAEKGDCYPLVTYDTTQTLMELKFGALTFWTRKAYGELIPDAGVAQAAAKYAADVAKFNAMASQEPLAPVMPQTTYPQGTWSGTAIAQAIKDPLSTIVRDEIRRVLAFGGDDREVSAFPVDASCPIWQDSGVRVRAGERVSIEAADGERWNIGQGESDANGYDFIPDGAGLAVFHTGTENQDWHWAALICAVGGNRTELDDPANEVEVGDKRELTIRNNGYLYFVANDRPERPDRPNGYDDNSGIIHVKVTVMKPADVPGSKDVDEGEDGNAAVSIVHQLEDPLRTLISQELWNALPGRDGDHSKSFPVDCASTAWQNSGVWAKAGQDVVVEAEPGDTWDPGWGPVSANGYPASHDSNADVPVFHTGVPNDDWHWGSLVCAVGNNREHLDTPEHEMEIGLKKQFTMDANGYIYFICNDQRAFEGKSGYDDNVGIIHVKVTVSDPPTLQSTAPVITPDTKAGSESSEPEDHSAAGISQ